MNILGPAICKWKTINLILQHSTMHHMLFSSLTSVAEVVGNTFKYIYKGSVKRIKICLRCYYIVRQVCKFGVRFRDSVLEYIEIQKTR